MIEPFELTDGVSVGAGSLVLIAGPCVIESEQMAVDTAGALREIAQRFKVSLIFKSSFDKANRSSIESFRGPGLDEGIRVLEAVKEATALPVITDVHDPTQAHIAGESVDILQVPAFLCRQTDLLLACGETGRPVNVKKGQFLAAEDMSNVVEKVAASGNQRIMLTERGTTFGYHNLVVDMRGLALMRRLAPVIFDVTHSLQLPGGLGHTTGGARDFHPYLARAAAAVGVDGFFVEVHPDPDKAKSDATTQLSIEEFEKLVPQLIAVDEAAKGFQV